MIAATDPCCVKPLLLFLQTLLDITLFRKGPEHIPRSMLALVFASVLWLLAVLLSMTALFGFSAQRFFLEAMLLLFALACYAGLLLFLGRPQRIQQTLAALLGAASITVFGLIVCTFVSVALFGQAGVQFVLTAYVIWSVSVKGHIIASALDRQWYFGAILAAVVFAMQLAISNIFRVQA